jgi:hypothetical protein
MEKLEPFTVSLYMEGKILYHWGRRLKSFDEVLNYSRLSSLALVRRNFRRKSRLSVSERHLTLEDRKGALAIHMKC